MPNVHELIRDHVTLSIRCLDRLYLHAYMPKLQTSGGLLLLARSSGTPNSLARPVPANPRSAHRRHQAVRRGARHPLITFERGQLKDDVVAGYRARRPMRERIVIGVAQEKMRASEQCLFP